MEDGKEYALCEPGLPRANSNGVLIAGLLVTGIFFVMTSSCDREQKVQQVVSSNTQALSGNEWFNGKAKGIERPKPIPTPTPTPKKINLTRNPNSQKVTPTKKLGGKVFNNSTNTKESRQASRESYDESITSFTPTTIRPDYYLDRNIELPISDFEVKAGTTITAQLDTTINSDLGGPAVAHVTRRVFDTLSGQFILIPPGTKLYGNVDRNVSFAQTRVDVVWQRLIFPNGSSLVVNNLRASDSAGQTGLHHTVDNHFDKLFGGAILLSAISSGVQLSQPQQNNGFGTAPSIGQTLAASLGQNLGQVSTEYVRRQMDVRPTLVIPTGEHFTIIVNKDMVFPGPYKGWR